RVTGRSRRDARSDAVAVPRASTPATARRSGSASARSSSPEDIVASVATEVAKIGAPSSGCADEQGWPRRAVPGPAHPLGPGVVRAVRGFLEAPGRDDGPADRSGRSGTRLSTFLSGRPDGVDRRLSGGPPRAGSRHPSPRAGGAYLGGTVVHADGRVPDLRRVPRAQPGVGARSRGRAWS